MQDDFNPKQWQLLYKGSTPIGMFTVRIHLGQIGIVSYICLLEEFRKQGLGVTLHKKAIDMLIEGRATIYEGGTLESNIPMQKTFMKNGCEHVGTRVIYKNNR